MHFIRHSVTDVRQRDAFLEKEGNAWYERNATRLGERKLPEGDPLLREILDLGPALQANPKVLEIGCGDATRLAWLKENRGCDCFGLDPSSEAVKAAKERGVDARQGTAESLPFDDASFDIVMFGFCLYLCDREDLFRIAAEADRVLKNPGWLLILDFFSPTPTKREYHHRAGLFSHKMDYRTLFDRNSAYTTMTFRVRHHSEDIYTDDRNEWTATSVLRKNLVDG
jgi:ubiquinone/menaquinone biosynthesis C-methylase UbiE